MKFEALNRDWTVTVLSADDFKRRFDDEAAAFTLPDSNEVVFSEDGLCLATVVHELTHCYYDSLCVSSAELTPHQIEEVFAEMFAIHGEKMLKLAKKIYYEIKD